LKTRPLELVLTPVDNQRLANLSGRDENLRQTRPLDVTIARRGERFRSRAQRAKAGRGAAKILRRR